MTPSLRPGIEPAARTWRRAPVCPVVRDSYTIAAILTDVDGNARHPHAPAPVVLRGAVVTLDPRAAALMEDLA